jgi:hypothetical protein
MGSAIIDDEENKIYAGIKLEITNTLKTKPNEGIISLSVESMKRRNISEYVKVKIIRN